ncbi:uncharacterized protein LOC118184078, partial [Stegodyphus dumicola]|uniref:uncharacterized protein LOC118184078 n=1 Tax=Stegodyphus dumicola TaxID=202533 RepID=UPI0015AC7E93
VSLGKLKRCHSLKLLRSRDKEKLSRSNSFKSTGTSPGPNHDFKNEIENIETIKKEKSSSMFSKWFRRGRWDKSRPKSKGTSSSTQFPPRDWSDPDYVLFNSRATQTLERTDGEHRIKVRSSSLNRTTSKERHSQVLSSTPATPRIAHRNSNRHQHASDSYHYRSSSLPRKKSPSPKRESRAHLPENTFPRVSNGYHLPSPNQQEDAKMRPRYESPFSPFTSRRKTQSLLMASDKYADNVQDKNSSHNNTNTMPYHSTNIIRSPPTTKKLPSFTPVEKKVESSAGWRRPTSLMSNLTQVTSLDEPLKQPPVRVIPRLTSKPREIASVPPSKPLPMNHTTTSKTIVDEFKTSETITKTFPANGKEIRLGTTVDVEISVGNNQNPQNKKTLLTTDLDSPIKSDLLKIATSWNHSIKSNNTKMSSEEFNKSSTGIPKLTTTTNITTSLSRGPIKENQRTEKIAETSPKSNLKNGSVIKQNTFLDCSTGRDSPSKETVCSSSPRSTLTADAKSEFFSESPNSTTEVHVSKDDSGFSSSASTSRPMSVSPC